MVFVAFRSLSIAALTAMMILSPVSAQTVGTQPIKIVSGYPPGGNNDIGARLFARELAERLKQPVIVENKPGAGGTIASRYVAGSPPDGRTLLYSDVTSMSTILSKNGLEVFKEFEPVSLMLTGTWVLYVSTKLPVKTFQELVTYAKARPAGNTLNFASTNIFATLAMGVLKKRTGMEFVNVPYKGQAQVALAMASGEVDISFESLNKPAIDAGRIRPLFVTRKSTVMPEIPTAAEAGVPDFSPDFHGGIWAPAATPKDVIAKLSTAFSEVVRVADVRERIRGALAAEPGGGSTEELRQDAEIGLKFLAEAARIANFQPE